ncbi:hypothetical protein ACF068_28390 [Streptomyces sp. NPDC016309]|uniref:DUF7144 family membrane protein n=1 Tax=Streptomyces sp. NPDC016309 TaxID=3364965 RepID=UPI0037016F24
MTTTHVKSKHSRAVAGGLVTFAAVLLIVAGLLDIFRGIMGIAEDDVFVATPDYIFQFDTTSWGWIHLLFGGLAVLVAFGLFKPTLWARMIGVVLASLLLIANFLSIPYYPLWSIVAIAMYAFIIWALCVVRTEKR